MESYVGVSITHEGREKLQSELKSRLDHERQVRLELPAKEARAVGNGSNGHAMTGEIHRQRQIDHNRIMELTKLINQARVIPPPKQFQFVQIGHVVSLVRSRCVNRVKRYVCVRYHIVGYEEGDCDSVPRKIAYNSRLGCELIGLRKNEKALIFLDGRMRTVRVSHIALPRQAA